MKYYNYRIFVVVDKLKLKYILKDMDTQIFVVPVLLIFFVVVV